MRLGVSISSTHPSDDHADRTRWMIERARAARDAGLDSLSLGDHHNRSYPYYQGVPMLGRLMAEWDPDRPIGCLFLLPLWNPVLVAEQVGTLATMTNAAFIIQAGIGDGEDQFATMNANIRTRGTDLEESMRVVKGLLAGERVSSERFGIVDAVVSPRPLRPVQWWLGGGRDAPIRRAARDADAWYAPPGATTEVLRSMMGIYQEARSGAGLGPGRTCLRKDVVVLDDAERARRLGDDLMARGYRGMSPNAVAYGGVSDVAEQFATYRDLGVDDIIVRCMSIDQADAVETLVRCGEVRAALR